MHVRSHVPFGAEYFPRSQCIQLEKQNCTRSLNIGNIDNSSANMAEDGWSSILALPAFTPKWPPKPWTPRALPQTPNTDGRPIWKPPVLNHSHLIDDTYHEKRKEALRYTKGDVVKTTEILDTSAEFDLLTMFDEWLGERA